MTTSTSPTIAWTRLLGTSDNDGADALATGTDGAVGGTRTVAAFHDSPVIRRAKGDPMFLISGRRVTDASTPLALEAAAGITGGRRAAGVTDFLGEALRRLQPCRRRRGAEGQDARRPGRIGHAGGQGGLGSDDDEVDGVFFAEGDDCRTVHDVDIRAFRQ